MKKAKAMAPQAERFLGRQAVVGVDTLKAILLTGFNAVSRGLPLKPFPGRDAAMSWLAS